jgi:hypothetical protein
MKSSTVIPATFAGAVPVTVTSADPATLVEVPSVEEMTAPEAFHHTSRSRSWIVVVHDAVHCAVKATPGAADTPPCRRMLAPVVGEAASAVVYVPAAVVALV